MNYDKNITSDKVFFLDSLKKLEEYCDLNDYKGWDPYDGLNSRIFQNTPFKNNAFARLAWIQLFKRNPINIRKVFLVDKGYNPKGLALFISGFCNLYRIESDKKYIDRIYYLSEKLLNLQNYDYSGACWGYNFDWQARGGLFFPSGTPTIVATAFCAIALFNAYEITSDEKYLKVALSSANFIEKDLTRTKKEKGFLFSYSPLKGNNTVYNASLLGSMLLSYCYKYSNKDSYAFLAKESIDACIEAQNDDGSWVYGELPIQNWIDSFHTGYNLVCLQAYQDNCKDRNYSAAIEKGLNYYVTNFFLENGTPKYYNNRVYPIDIHCPAQFFVTLSRLNCFNQNKSLVKRVIKYVICNFQDSSGYYYYQIHKQYKIKIPYMRWSQAFMFYGLSYFFKEMARIYK